MFFAPYVIRGSNAEKVLVQILPASYVLNQCFWL